MDPPTIRHLEFPPTTYPAPPQPHQAMPLRPGQKPISRQTDTFQRQLVCEWTYTWTHVDRATYRLTLPRDVVYNPSAPGVSAAVISISRMQIPSAAHDPIYRLQGETGKILERRVETAKEVKWLPTHKVSRRFADQLFVHLMRQLDVKPWKRRVAWMGIRSKFGARAWEDTSNPPHPKIRP